MSDCRGKTDYYKYGEVTSGARNKLKAKLFEFDIKVLEPVSGSVIMPEKELTKILYVEDEPDIAQVAKLALEAIGGFTIETCENGKIALEKGPAFDPDLVLMDVMMPEMDGPSALGEMKKMPELQNVPVIFMTAKVQPAEIEEYKALGAVDVIPKPFDPMTLAEQVKQVWSNC